MSIQQIFLQHPILPAVWEADAIRAAIRSDCAVLHLAGGTLTDIEDILAEVKAVGKRVFVHPEMTAGLARDPEAARYLISRCGADGVISNSASVVQKALSLGAHGILRVFVHDTQSVESGVQQARRCQPTAVEVLPAAVAGELVPLFRCEARCPVIAAGLIRSSEQVQSLLQTGVLAVDTSNQKLWGITRPRQETFGV